MSITTTTDLIAPSPARAADLARPLTELADLLDRDAITALVHRLGAALDEGRFDVLPNLCTADVTAQTPGGVAEGIDAVVAQAARNHDPAQAIQHAITDVLIDLDPVGGAGADRAEVRANLVVTFADPQGGSRVDRRMGSVYGFEARRTADGWRFGRIATTVVWDERDR